MLPPPEDLKYTTSHLWLMANFPVCKLGITEFAQDQLGDLVYVTLPEAGKYYQRGEVVAVLESVKSASEIVMPVSGIVTEINITLADQPELINQAPYTEGWLFAVELDTKDSETVSTLLSAADYDALLDA